MMNADEVLWLNPEVKLEPLMARWYAWSYLIPPAQWALNLAFRYVPLLQSFVSNPSLHVAAARDPALFGGPFVQLTERDVERVRALIAETNSTCGSALALARDLRQLDTTLQSSATGTALTQYYERLQPSLRGLVDLSYDTNSHPRLRVHESLLYDEHAAARPEQILLSRTQDAQRPFFMSTPRLHTEDSLTLDMPFADERVDLLARLRTAPCALRQIVESLGIPGRDVPLLAQLLTRTPPRPRNTYTGDGVRVRYFGHACVLIQTAAVAILIDPLLATTPANDGRFTYADLPDFIDVVVISHTHQDHCVPEVLLQLRHRTGCVLVPRNSPGDLADPSLQLILKHLGFRNVRVTDQFDETLISDGRIISLPFPGEHADLDVCCRQAVLVTLKGRALLFAVDSDCRDSALYGRIMRRLNQRIDALFLGMECQGAPLTWLYGPLLSKGVSRRDDESRRLSGSDCEGAWNMVREIKPLQVFVYAMGQEPWLRYLMGLEYTADSVQLRESGGLLTRCIESGIPAQRLHISHEFHV